MDQIDYFFQKIKQYVIAEDVKSWEQNYQFGNIFLNQFLLSFLYEKKNFL